MVRHRHSAHLEAADRGWSPTPWQKSLHPRAFHDKIDIIFDGVDTHFFRPDARATFEAPGGATLTTSDEVITYAARSLEPCRGFPNFFTALPQILAQRPAARILIAGDAQCHYDVPPSRDLTWREALAREVEIDPDRVHFVGILPRSRYLRLLQVSSLHVYLTGPIVLSWSFLEAMSAGSLVVASDTPPGRDGLVPESNGLSTSFDDPEQIAEDVMAALSQPRGPELRLPGVRSRRPCRWTTPCWPRSSCCEASSLREGIAVTARSRNEAGEGLRINLWPVRDAISSTALSDF